MAVCLSSKVAICALGPPLRYRQTRAEVKGKQKEGRKGT